MSLSLSLSLFVAFVVVVEVGIRRWQWGLFSVGSFVVFVGCCLWVHASERTPAMPLPLFVKNTNFV